ncbi:unnamed protein product, partial [Ectocarpus sp. 8 AP-2014]
SVRPPTRRGCWRLSQGTLWRRGPALRPESLARCGCCRRSGTRWPGRRHPALRLWRSCCTCCCRPLALGTRPRRASSTLRSGANARLSLPCRVARPRPRHGSCWRSARGPGRGGGACSPSCTPLCRA